MGLFNRAPRPRLPADMPQLLETFGRYWLDEHHSGIDGGELWSRLGKLYEYARSDRTGFLRELGAITAADRGGFATLGAARLVWEFFDSDARRDPATLPFIDAGIEFKLARGLPNAMLTGYEMRRLAELREQAG
ncbi:hypothetical protein CS0771_33090 [Catellatospora sp. IY07-71]|uniref:hypothetical protein n=1 Tax=Catellatospora sp. IY07-71 TaxID=2728827 RepID=UPI001BB40AC3|nr:hypothetical protein [Catellatospora sp. IY07-71]BCJ73765.1 hypothetical protein CS0771_33090 [Catellatospora sp. IY07-71]